jgi:predicted Zn-dependent protease
MDREETRLRRSPFAIRDPALREYVQGIACKLAGEHCPDVRVHLLSTPLFNASMAPNGMMQVWTGLMLRMENEAQPAILGHGLALSRAIASSNCATPSAQRLDSFSVCSA